MVTLLNTIIIFFLSASSGISSRGGTRASRRSKTTSSTAFFSRPMCAAARAYPCRRLFTDALSPLVFVHLSLQERRTSFSLNHGHERKCKSTTFYSFHTVFLQKTWAKDCISSPTPLSFFPLRTSLFLVIRRLFHGEKPARMLQTGPVRPSETAMSIHPRR